jgi:hypothetical protein
MTRSLRHLALLATLLGSAPALAANTPISGLPSGCNAVTGDLFPATRNGITYGVTYPPFVGITALTGDVTATGPNSAIATVGAINGVPLGATTATAGNLLIGSSSQWISRVLSGDCTLSSAGAITCTKTNGVSFAPSATTDTTNAANISSGTIGVARLPLGSTITPGALQPDGSTIGVSGGVISVIGGGGGVIYQNEQLVSSGLTATTTNAGTNVFWNSAATGIKTDTIPAATGSKKLITITDVAGTAGNAGNYIAAVPVSGNIIGNSLVYTSSGSITLYDSQTLMAWVSQ